MDAKLFDWLKEDLTQMRAELKSEIKQLDDKVEQILQFKWQIVGGSVVISAILSFAVSLLFAMIDK